MRRPRGAERGAALVEGAFAIPIFFVMVLGLVDFGMLAFESNKASNAARDGARVGIIDYLEADVVGSADYNAIKNEIESKLQGQTINLEVKCLTPGGGDIDCTNAVVDQDRISVKVTWDRKAISPLGNALGIGSVEVDGESRMTIVGRPIGGPASPPPPCNITGVSVSPDPVTRTLTGELQSDLTVTVAGTGTCSNETVALISSDGISEREICVSGCLGTIPYDADTDTFWTVPGTARAVVRDGAAATIVDTTFEVEDPIVPALCEVTDVVVSPNPVQRIVGGANDGTLADNLAIEVLGSGACTNLTLTLVAPDGSSVVICGPGNCLGVTAYSAIANNFWTAGTAEARITGEQTVTGTFTVTDQPPCAVDITIANDPAKIDGQGRISNFDGNVRQRVTVAMSSGSGPCPSFTVTMTPPSGTNTVTLCPPGPCTGVIEYVDGDKIWDPPGGATEADAEVEVSGTGFSETATFVVTK